MAMATYDHLDEGTLDSRVRMWRPAIEYCFKKSDVVTKLAQHGLLDAEETARLIELYDQKPSQDASREMFNILFKKRVPKRKWKTFLDAITEAGYEFVVSRLINETVEIAEERERGKQLLLLFGPHLERDINPLLLTTRLLASSIIKQEDANKIENTTLTKSEAEGMRILLQRIQCYMEPHKWWEAFLTVLWETEFEHMALLLEPEYFPTSKKLGPIDDYECAKSPADVQEHVLEVHVPSQPENDLNAPPESFREKDEDILIEENLKWWRQAIVRCIQTPMLASRLAQYDVINADEKSRLVNLYHHQPPHVASEELIEIIINKNRPRKWQDFIKALEKEGFIYVKSRLVPYQTETLEEREHGRKLVQLFGPKLEQDIDPIPLLLYLQNHGALHAVDVDEIKNLTLNKSMVLGMMYLLDRVQCYLKPSDWWYHLLSALWRGGHKKKVKKIEPGYAPSSELLEDDACASSYKSENQGILKEHIMTDQVDAEPDNDLNSPPTPTRTYSSRTVKFEDEVTFHTRHATGVMTSTADQMKSVNENLKELNIKPEQMKSVDAVAYDSDSAESNEWESDKGGSDIDEDDENQGSKISPERTYELRDYQLELSEKALRGTNTIICAETGTGKTWVALHVIDKHLAQASKSPKKVAFMARTGVLIKQQSNRFQKYLPHYNTKLITGDDEDSRMVDAFIPTNDIICFTPQILVNSLDSGNISSLSKFSLLVFDECHHTRGDEPYARLARKYLIEKANGQKELPQVVGLTASIGVGRSRTVEETVDYILHVCASLDVRPSLSTVERCRESLKKWVNTPEEETIKMIVKNPDPCKDILLEAMEDAEALLEEMIYLQPEMIDMMYEKRPGERDSQAYNKWTIDIEKSAQQNVNDHEISRDISACAVYLNVYNSAIEVSNLLQIAEVAKYLSEKHHCELEGRKKHTDTEKKLFDNLIDVQRKLNKLKNDKDAANPNVQIVSEQLQKMILAKGDDSRALVFVQARATCRALAKYLDQDLQKIGVKASRLYGQQTKGADEGMTEAVQTETLQKFRDGYYKVMVCTSVGTEGIDVPDCNIVINYNYSGDEITKIQMKGRSRKKGATILLMGHDKQLEQEMINAYKANMMYKAIVELQKINARAVEQKLKMFQTEEMQKHRYKTEYEKAKKSRRAEDDLEILCRRCNSMACLVSDVRKLGSQHFVIAKDFPSKITTKPHKSPKKYDGIEKKGKMYCKKCPLDWGIVADRDGVDLFILKLQCFKLRNTRTGVISQHKKWLDVPYDVQELGLEDIPKFFRNEAGEDASPE